MRCYDLSLLQLLLGAALCLLLVQARSLQEEELQQHALSGQENGSADEVTSVGATKDENSKEPVKKASLTDDKKKFDPDDKERKRNKAKSKGRTKRAPGPKRGTVRQKGRPLTKTGGRSLGTGDLGSKISRIIEQFSAEHKAQEQDHSDLHEVKFSNSGGIARATDSFTGFPPSQAFEGSGSYQGDPNRDDRFWHSGNHLTDPTLLWYEFPEKVRVVKYSFRSRRWGEDQHIRDDGPSKYTFWASNADDCTDETKWDKLYEDNSGTPFDLDNTPKSVSLQNSNFYRCYGFKVTDVPGRSKTSRWATAGNKWVTISDVHFYSTSDEVVAILVDERDGPNADGSYSFNFETGDGTSVLEQGYPTASGGVAKKGTYSLTYPDGNNGVFKWIADENGFRVESPLLPTPPPIPPHAQIDAAAQA